MRHLFHTEEIQHFKSLALLIKNKTRALEFYQDILGFHVIYEDKNIVRLSANQTDVILELIEDRNALEQEVTLGLYHFALLLSNKVELSRIIRQLRDKHYPITGASDHGVSEAIYLDDPDGNGIELYVDYPYEMWPRANDKLRMTTDVLNLEALMKVDDQKPYQIDPNLILGHIHLHVSNLDEATKFYRDALDFQVTQDYMQSARFLSSGGYHHHLGINIWHQGAPMNQSKQVGLKALWLYIPKKGAIAFYRRLSDQRVLILNENETSYIIDPLGIKIYLEFGK